MDLDIVTLFEPQGLYNCRRQAHGQTVSPLGHLHMRFPEVDRIYMA
jgi:hypothetical protein